MNINLNFKTMKKGLILFLIASVFAIGSAFGQNPFKGFFQPAQKVIPSLLLQKEVKGMFTSGIVDSTVFAFRPAVSLTALDLSFKNGSLVTNPMGAVGFGIEYDAFTLVNGKPYVLYGINAEVITNYSLNGASFTGIGGAISIKTFNIASIGVGYLNNSVHILAGVNYNF